MTCGREPVVLGSKKEKKTRRLIGCPLISPAHPLSPQGLSVCRKVKRLHLCSGSRISISGQRVCDQPSFSFVVSASRTSWCLRASSGEGAGVG